LLREYGEIIPNGADRLMRMTESNQQLNAELARRKMGLAESQLDGQREDARASRAERRIGQIGAIALTLIVVAGVCVLGATEHPVVAALLGTGGLTGLLGTYMYGHKAEPVSENPPARSANPENPEEPPAKREEELSGDQHRAI
jgi:uncharacterized membrane protein